MQLLKVDSIEQAREKLLDCASRWELPTETLPFEKAYGRILARDVFSPEDVPAFNRSTVDGYALRSVDTAAAGDSIPAFLKRAGAVEMGRAAECGVSPGECVEVPTGGMLPEGADAVIMLEYTEAFGEGIAVHSSVAPGENTVLAGEDIKAGDVLLKRGTRLLPRHIGALAAVGKTQIDVYCPLKLAVFSTGDEVKDPREKLEAGQVHDINSYSLAALAESSGFEIVRGGLLQDDEALLREAVRESMADCDVVLVSGGSSQGTKDLTAKILDEIASPGVFTHGLAIKPGKPTILGADAQSRTILCGLPGHPVSAMMVFEMLFGWLYREMTGVREKPAIPATLTVNLASSPGKLNCWPVRLERDEDKWLAVPIFGKSGLITTLSGADGYFTVQRGREGMSAGETVMVNLF